MSLSGKRPRFPADLFWLVPFLFVLWRCAEGLPPDPGDYPPIIDEVQNLAGIPIQGAVMGDTVYVTGRHFAPTARVFFGRGEGAVLAVNAEGTRIRAVVPVTESPGPVLLHVQVGDRKSNGVAFQISSAHALFVGPNPDRVFAVDLDRDGNQDLIVASLFPPAVTVLRGRGDGTYSRGEAVRYGFKVPSLPAVGDLNHDGVPDLVLWVMGASSTGGPDTPGELLVFLGSGDGSFLEPIVQEADGKLASLAIGDLNGDGIPDLIAVHGAKNGLSVFTGNGDGTFRVGVFHPTDLPISLLLIQDLDQDGNADGVLAGGDSLFLLLGDGRGAYREADSFFVGENVSALAAGDLDGDGRLDLAVAYTGTPSVEGGVSVFLGDGHGSFGFAGFHPAAQAPVSVALGDLDGDGRPDLAVADRGGGDAVILLNGGDGTFRAGPGMSGGRYFSGRGPSCVVGSDLDGDGALDLVLTNRDSGSLTILPGSGDGTFRHAPGWKTGERPGDLAAVDLDGDGIADLAVTHLGPHHSPGGLSVLSGKGDGAFHEAVHYRVGAGPVSVAAGDLNNDGHPDLVVSFQGAAPVFTGGFSVLLGIGDGTLRDAVNHRTGWTPGDAGLADLNGDGNQDLVVVHHGHLEASYDPRRGVSVFMGNGDGTFRRLSSIQTDLVYSSIALGDLDGDGAADLALTSWFDPRVSVFEGNGNGTFRGPFFHGGEEGVNRSVTMRDLNGNGYPDLVVANYGPVHVVYPPMVPEEYGHASVYLNQGDGTFSEAVKYLAPGNFTRVVVADLEGDGQVDLVLSSRTNCSVSVLLGNGDGTFGEAVNYLAGRAPHAAAAGDFDGDGRPDLAVSDREGGSVTVLFTGK